jgi:hypothetical protein
MTHTIENMNKINTVSQELVNLLINNDLDLDCISAKLNEREALIKQLSSLPPELDAPVTVTERLLELKIMFSKLNGIIMTHLFGLVKTKGEELAHVQTQRKAIQSYKFQL